MKERVLAERYAKALVELGEEEKSLERFQEELDRFSKALRIDPNLLTLLSSREVNWDIRSQILKGLILKLMLSPYVQNFLFLLLRRRRMRLFPEIVNAFEALMRQMDNIVIAAVTVADLQGFKPHSAKLKSALEKKTGKKIEIRMEEDPELMGGLQIALGDKIYDASIQGELERIRETWG